LDKVNPEVIKFKFANSDHKNLMTDKILQPGVGICHEVFKENMTTANQEIDLTKSEGICN